MGIDTTGGAVSFGGLSSGLDTKAIVDALTKVAAAPIDRIRGQEAVLRQQQGLYANVSTAMQALSQVASTLDSPLDFGQLAATGGAAGVIQAVAGAGAQAGAYQVSVDQLAAAQRNYSNAVTDPTAGGLYTGSPGGSGTISFVAPGNNALDVTVDASTSLDDIAIAINGAGLGATASVLSDASGARLVFSALTPGAANAIQITETDVATGLSAAANQAQAAQDAQLTLDGIGHITRGSNTVADAIPGLTLQLESVTAQPQTLTVAVDEAAMAAKVSGFVGAYNNVIGAIQKATGTAGGTSTDRLVGDTTLRNMQLDLQKTLGAATGGSFGSLAAVGISTQRDGTLALDQGAFTAALAQNYGAVAQLFISDVTHGTVGVGVTMQNLSTTYTDFASGALTVRGQSIDSQIRGMDSRIVGLQRNVDAYTASLKQRFNALEEQMAKLRSQNAFLVQEQRH